MRLTLRTLLAYLDDILEPADARELGQKIEESEFASGLVHRIRSVTRKLRLGAPKLSGKGMGLDANTVAEYLDNTLPQDRVPDFERVCLESDVHLAEVASCHQILTLVLGEPADVDPILREKVRSLQLVGDIPPEEDAPPLPPAAASVPDVSPKGRWRDEPQPEETPDELPPIPRIIPTNVASPVAAPTRIRLLPIVGTLVVTFLLALVALVAMGPLDATHPILGRILADASRNQDTGMGEPALSTPPTSPAEDQSPIAAEPADTQSPDTPRGDRDATAVHASTDTDAAETAPSTDPTDSDAAPPADSDRTGIAPVPPSEMPPVEPTEVEPAVGPAPTEPMDAEPDTATETEAAVPGEAPAVLNEGEEEDKEPEPLAHCVSSLHILAQWEPGTETWLRVPANAAISPPADLIALPTYRPQVAFTAGVQMLLVGPAAAALTQPDATGTPTVLIRHGRFILTADGTPTAAVNLDIGGRISRATLPDKDSALALEVRRYHPPGTDPEATAAHWWIQGVVVAGKVVWQDGESDEAAVLEAGQSLARLDTETVRITTTASSPDWLNAQSLRPIDRDASRQLEPLLKLDRPLTTSLLEQAANRLVEVRALAIRALAGLGTYDPFVNALNDRTYRSFWPDLMEALEASLSHDEAAATQIRMMLERLRGEDGSKLYRILWGFSAQQLEEGAAAMLVELLSSPAMDLRVYAYHQLQRIAGKTNGYQPELDPSRQRTAIRNWQRDLEAGAITNAPAPSTANP